MKSIQTILSFHGFWYTITRASSSSPKMTNMQMFQLLIRSGSRMPSIALQHRRRGGSLNAAGVRWRGARRDARVVAAHSLTAVMLSP